MVGLTCCACLQARPPPGPTCVATTVDTPFFHGDRARLGWNAEETTLTPPAVASSAFGELWSSPQLDAVTIAGRAYAPHLYATPLYVDDVALGAGRRAGLAIVATTSGFAYAIGTGIGCGAAVPGRGQIVWRAQLGTPIIAPFDGNLPLGVLSTPAVDVDAGRVYVVAADAQRGWQAFALDLASGAVLPGWPVVLDEVSLGAVNTNGPALFEGPLVQSQRSALNLSPDGSLLYVPFGAYFDGGGGWLAVIDTRAPNVASAFSGAPSMEHFANAGVWGSGGPALSADGTVWVTTGNSPPASKALPHVWGNSMLAFAPPLVLAGSYNPWDFCQMEDYDSDLGGGAPLVVPDLDAGATATPHLLAFGGKQGNVYLLDRDHLPGGTDRRPACSTDPSSDRSLLPPAPQPQFGTRGPLNVFGPYSEQFASGDYAKSRTSAAFFRGRDGTNYLYVAGTTKAAVDSELSVPPCLARLRIVTAPGQPAYLAVDARESQLSFLNPGPPEISSNGARDAIVWILDENAKRTAFLTGPDPPRPILYAVDAETMTLLWKSAWGQLEVGGKYNHVTIAHGLVLVGTDRLRAFGVRP